VQLNQAFDRLRQYIRLPGLNKKKLSKVDILRAAGVYIKQLTSKLYTETEPAPPTCSAAEFHPQLQPCQQLQQPLYHQPSPDAAITPSFLLLPVLKNSINSPAESPQVVPALASGLLATAPIALQDSAAFSDVDANNYIIADHCPLWSSPEDNHVNIADDLDQQQRVHDITAWLMQMQ